MIARGRTNRNSFGSRLLAQWFMLRKEKQARWKSNRSYLKPQESCWKVWKRRAIHFFRDGRDPECISQVAWDLIRSRSTQAMLGQPHLIGQLACKALSHRHISRWLSIRKMLWSSSGSIKPGVAPLEASLNTLKMLLLQEKYERGEKENVDDVMMFKRW